MMNTSNEMREKQRLIIAKSGRMLLKVALLLGILAGITTTFLPSASRYGLALAGIAAITAPLGVVFELVYSKIGWSDNRLIDFCLNQASIFALISGYLIGALYVGSFVVYGTDSSFLLTVSILFSVSSAILFALGLRFSSPGA